MFYSCRKKVLWSHFLMFSGSTVINNGTSVQLKNIGYKEMAGNYKCTVTGVGGESSGKSTLQVYCKY